MDGANIENIEKEKGSVGGVCEKNEISEEELEKELLEKTEVEDLLEALKIKIKLEEYLKFVEEIEKRIEDKYDELKNDKKIDIDAVHWGFNNLDELRDVLKDLINNLDNLINNVLIKVLSRNEKIMEIGDKIWDEIHKEVFGNIKSEKLRDYIDAVLDESLIDSFKSLLYT